MDEYFSSLFYSPLIKKNFFEKKRVVYHVNLDCSMVLQKMTISDLRSK